MTGIIFFSFPATPWSRGRIFLCGRVFDDGMWVVIGSIVLMLVESSLAAVGSSFGDIGRYHSDVRLFCSTCRCSTEKRVAVWLQFQISVYNLFIACSIYSGIRRRLAKNYNDPCHFRHGSLTVETTWKFPWWSGSPQTQCTRRLLSFKDIIESGNEVYRIFFIGMKNSW